MEAEQGKTPEAFQDRKSAKTAGDSSNHTFCL